MSANARQLGEWIVNDAEASGALEIVGCRSPIEPFQIPRELEYLLARMPHVQHVTATVLADKTQTIHAFVECGFEFTAYLPAWYKSGHFRYDCVQLAKRRYACRPCTQDFEEVLDILESELQSSPYAHRREPWQFAASASRI